MVIVVPEFSWLLVILAVGAVLALIDGITRVRGKAAILAIVELILAALLILSLFVVVPLGQFALSLALVVVLIIQLVVGGRRGWLGAIAIVLLGLFVLLTPDRLIIPGVNA